MLILASKSPRRRELITSLGREFTVKTADADETLPAGISPAEAVTLLATRKAEAGAVGESPLDFVIGADTLVFYKNEPLGKPRDSEDAVRMLTLLSGTEHLVLTGVAVVHGGVTLAAADTTVVKFRKLSHAEILRYVKTGEPLDKAGAYGIQGKGGRLVDSYRGNFDNVIGLPCLLLQSLIETHEMRDKMNKVTQRLKELYPDATCALTYEGDPWRLLVMGRLSAQCTDKRVNMVTPAVFRDFPDPAAMAQTTPEILYPYVKSCGFSAKAKTHCRIIRQIPRRRYSGSTPMA